MSGSLSNKVDDFRGANKLQEEAVQVASQSATVVQTATTLLYCSVKRGCSRCSSVSTAWNCPACRVVMHA